MEEKDRNRLKRAMNTMKELAPKMYGILEEGFYVINCKKKSPLEQIRSAVKIYLYAKTIKLTPRATELLVMFVKYDTSTASRKKIRRQIDMTAGTLNQNASNLRKAGILLYPYQDSKKSVIDPNLVALKKYMVQKRNGNILVKYNE